MSTKAMPAGPESDNGMHDLSSLPKAVPPGAWVALSPDKSRVLGTGISRQAATYQAEIRGESSPVLIQMPVEEESVGANGK
jgi:hypothetical protein